MKNILTLLLLLSAAVGHAAPITWKADATLTSPTQGVVTVTANIEDGWHIYSAPIPDNGPLPTVVTASSDNENLHWLDDHFTPSVAPTSNIDNLFHLKLLWWEHEVTFTRHFEIPANASATITVGASYIVCDDKSCNQPPNFTATLTVGNPADNTSAEDIKANANVKPSATPDTLSTAPQDDVAVPQAHLHSISRTTLIWLLFGALLCGIVGGVAGAWMYNAYRNRNNRQNKK